MALSGRLVLFLQCSDTVVWATKRAHSGTSTSLASLYYKMAVKMERERETYLLTVCLDAHNKCLQGTEGAGTYVFIAHLDKEGLSC